MTNHPGFDAHKINQMKQLFNAIAIILLVFRKPNVFNVHTMRLLTELYQMIFDVASEGKPRMTRIAIILPENERHDVVSLWAGPGHDASPDKRIRELLAENSALKKIKGYTIDDLIAVRNHLSLKAAETGDIDAGATAHSFSDVIKYLSGL